MTGGPMEDGCFLAFDANGHLVPTGVGVTLKTRPERRSVVYVVENRLTGFVKIGYTTQLRDRIKGLENACGCKLHLLLSFDGGTDTERRLHQRFANDRQVGEWFTYSQDIRDWLLGMRS